MISSQCKNNLEQPLASLRGIKIHELWKLTWSFECMGTNVFHLGLNSTNVGRWLNRLCSFYLMTYLLLLVDTQTWPPWPISTCCPKTKCIASSWSSILPPIAIQCIAHQYGQWLGSVGMLVVQDYRLQKDHRKSQGAQIAEGCLKAQLHGIYESPC